MNRSRSARSSRNQRGGVLILVASTLVVLIGAVGLAIDSGRAYGVKARLNAAVDAAAIAAARGLAEGVDDIARISNAEAAALRFFKLNYPAGFLSSTPSTPHMTAVREDSGRWRVTVAASAEMPTTFMRVLGTNEVDVAARGEAIRRDLDVMLVMDTSGSLGPPTSNATTFPTLKQAARTGFVDKFSAGAGGDRVGLVSFAAGAVLDVPINKNSDRGFSHSQVVNRINALSATGVTATAEGLRKAREELGEVPPELRSSLRVILLFSDGAPNVINGEFARTNAAGNPLAPITGNLYSETSSGVAPKRVWPADKRDGLESSNFIATLPETGSSGVSLASFDNRRTLSGTPYANTRCNVNKAARNMVENIANTVRNEDIRIYTIGLGEPLNRLEIGFCGYTLAKERGSTILKRIANTADSDTFNAAQPQGLYCHAATESELQRCFSTIASEVLRLTL
jgi:Flp pilus assembly protein TadG